MVYSYGKYQKDGLFMGARELLVSKREWAEPFVAERNLFRFAVFGEGKNK